MLGWLRRTWRDLRQACERVQTRITEAVRRQRVEQQIRDDERLARELQAREQARASAPQLTLTTTAARGGRGGATQGDGGDDDDEEEIRRMIVGALFGPGGVVPAGEAGQWRVRVRVRGDSADIAAALRRLRSELSRAAYGQAAATRSGADSALVSSLPTHKPSEEGGTAVACSDNNTTASGGGNSRCVICLSDYEEGDEVRTLPCLHMMHTSCVDAWLRISDVCPVCRAQVATV
ncbi:E3 ubiquitin-protein ligase RNF11 [Pelomyxa schiedti]|nr:E3 ubiquitin-protein ligase RNF11 [Pelomyxa schiedti]